MSVDVKRAARELAVDPKRFRQFLRSHPQYRSPGAGGKYDLSAFTIEYLSEQYALWAGVTTSTLAGELDDIDDDNSAPGLPLGSPLDEVRALNRARDRRLLSRLRELGMSVASQRDHPMWLSVTTSRLD